MDKRLEQLINRKLDEQLDDAESLELDKLLIRDPQAREYLAEAQRIDRIAAECLQEICDRTVDVVDIEVATVRRKSPWLWSRAVPTAIAACLLLALGWQWLQPASRPVDGPTLTPHVAQPRIVDRPMLASDNGQSAMGRDWPNPLRRVNTNSTYYTVYDEASGKTYILEVRETGSTVRPNPLSATPRASDVVLTSGEM